MRTLTPALVIATGAIGNSWVSNQVSAFLPGMFQTRPLNYVVGLGTAGVLGAGVGMVNKKWAGPVFFGGVLEVVMRGVKDYVLPMLPFGMAGLGRFGDYLTRADAADSRALGDYLTRANAAESRALGDYLTRANAAESRALGGLGATYDYYGESSIADELSGV